MKCRFKNTHQECWSSQFNTHGMSEVIVGWDNGGDDAGQDSCFIKDLDVLISNEWKDLGSAFRDRDLITDNYNTIFFPPKNNIDKERGYSLY